MSEPRFRGRPAPPLEDDPDARFADEVATPASDAILDAPMFKVSRSRAAQPVDDLTGTPYL